MINFFEDKKIIQNIMRNVISTRNINQSTTEEEQYIYNEKLDLEVPILTKKEQKHLAKLFFAGKWNQPKVEQYFNKINIHLIEPLLDSKEEKELMCIKYWLNRDPVARYMQIIDNKIKITDTNSIYFDGVKETPQSFLIDTKRIQIDNGVYEQNFSFSFLKHIATEKFKIKPEEFKDFYVKIATDFIRASEIITKYLDETEKNIRTWEPLKNMTQKAQRVANGVQFNRYFKTIEIDPSSNLEVIQSLGKEFEKIIQFLPEELKDDLTLRFRKTDYAKASAIYNSAYKTIAINIKPYNSEVQEKYDTNHIQSFMHELAHAMDYHLGINEKLNTGNLFDSDLAITVPYSEINEPFKNLVDKYRKTYEIAVANNELEQQNKKMDYYTSNKEVFARGFEWYLNQINFDSSFNKNIDEYNERVNVFDKLDESDKNKFKSIYESIFKIEQKLKEHQEQLKTKTQENLFDNQDSEFKKEMFNFEPRIPTQKVEYRQLSLFEDYDEPIKQSESNLENKVSNKEIDELITDVEEYLAKVEKTNREDKSEELEQQLEQQIQKRRTMRM
ncbi:Uncharacterised protein [Mycoplasmopsis bovigenitalium]|uniref:Uncharacterized protein n=1 Tax=Mycoplasmopsis bovigenitalium TaxID=2112 RepID=A0A449A8Q3_9BACT|nr:hypothetical protein [Mycoplasmopsis bovigenitalium]VEU60604.1 Uncharacterised protein [Mycoplasmopsis bovigenitalium]